MPEHVVLVDGHGRAAGVVPKADAHHSATPFHLAFSCHVFDRHGRALLARRALTKRTWPGVWSNACCGHPQLGESLHDAVARRLEEELGVSASRLELALADFTYRAAMDDGTVEHELCPVFVAEIDGEPLPDPAEVDAVEWLPWNDVVARATCAPQTLTPWAVAQIDRLRAGGWSASAIVGAPLELGAPVLRRPRHRSGSAGFALDPVVGPVEALLDRHLQSKAAQLHDLDPVVRAVTDEIGGLVRAGGKRLRPAFVVWGHQATGAAPDDRVLAAAAALELLHTFALLHDDVMDRSVARRGRPTAHVTLASRRCASAPGCDASWFGISAAILAGDLAEVWADELLAAASFPPDAAARARAVFTTLREEVIAGQFLDLVAAADGAVDERTVLQVARLKSARYTVTRPLLLGAALATRGSCGVDAALTAYGDAVGLAFQLRDDVLGVFGDPAITGKSVVDDIREGKRTLLVVRALQLATPAQRAALQAQLGDPCTDAAGAARFREVVADSGALASVEALIADRHAAALDAIVGLPEPAQTALVALADLAVCRAA